MQRYGGDTVSLLYNMYCTIGEYVSVCEFDDGTGLNGARCGRIPHALMHRREQSIAKGGYDNRISRQQVHPQSVRSAFVDSETQSACARDIDPYYFK